MSKFRFFKKKKCPPHEVRHYTDEVCIHCGEKGITLQKLWEQMGFRDDQFIVYITDETMDRPPEDEGKGGNKSPKKPKG